MKRVAEVRESSTRGNDGSQLANIIRKILEEPYNLDKMLSGVLTEIMESNGLSAGSVHILDRKQGELQLKIANNLPNDVLKRLSKIAIGQNSIQKPRNGRKRSPGPLGEDALKIEHALSSLLNSPLIIPLASKNELLGVMCLVSNRGFTSKQVKFLKSLGAHIGLAINNIDQNSGLLKRVGKLTSLLSISATIELKLKLEQLLDLITQQAAALLEAGFCYLALVTYDEESLEIKSCFGNPSAKGTRLDINNTLSGKVFNQGRGLIVDNASSGTFASNKEAEIIKDVKSAIIVPMLTMDRPLGTLMVANKAGENAHFTLDDQELLAALANQVGMILDNFMLFEKISRGKAEWEDLFDSLTDLICIHDREFQIMRVNKAFAKRVRTTPQGLLGKKCYEVIYGTKLNVNPPQASHSNQDSNGAILEDKAPAPECPHAAVIENNRAYEAELDLPNLNGVFILSTFPLFDSQLEPYASVHILKDITLQKKLEQELLQAQKMESIGTLAGGIAHDFNNVLAAIIPNAEMMKIRLPSTDPNFKRAETIEKAAKRAASLTNQLLSFSRKWKLTLAIVNPNESIEATLDLLDSLISKNIAVEKKLSPDIWSIQAGEAQLEQIVMNLALNACDAMPKGGKLSFKTENLILTEEFCKTKLGLKAGKYVCISVCDTGSGMEKEVLERAFEPFFTTKKVGKGTGLGLSVVYGIVKNYGGYIEVNSQLGVGTDFYLYFPACEKTLKKETPSQAEPLRGYGKILIIDDEELVRDVLTEILEKLGYEVITAASGPEALEIYEKKSGDIELVILDMTMPKMGGEKVYNYLRGINPTVSVLLSSGFSQEGKIQEVIEDNITGFIQKPYTIEQISRAVKNAINNRPEQEEPKSRGTNRL